MGAYAEQLGAQMSRLLGAEQIFPTGSSPLVLDPHQSQAISDLQSALTHGERAMSIIQTCGAGKTIVAAIALKASKRAKEALGMKSPDLVVVPERAPLKYIAQTLDQFADVGVWGAGQKKLDKEVIVATVQALVHNRDKLSEVLPFGLDEVPLIIGDEADLHLTKLRSQVFDMFPNALRIGLTATEGSNLDSRHVTDVWGDKIHQLSLLEGIESGINVPPFFLCFESNASLQNVPMSGYEYNQKVLKQNLLEAKTHQSVLQVYQQLIDDTNYKDFPTLVYVPSVDLVNQTVQIFRDHYQTRRLVSGWTGEYTDITQIENDQRLFNDGKLDILVMCQMGGRGMDVPRARLLIDASPTRVWRKLEQRHARVLRRIHPHSSLYGEFQKPFAVVAQVIPQTSKFTPCLLPDLLDWQGQAQGELFPFAAKPSSDWYENFHRRYSLETLRKKIDKSKLKLPQTYVRLFRQKNYEETIQANKRRREELNLPQIGPSGMVIGAEIAGVFKTLADWSTELSIPLRTLQRVTKNIAPFRALDYQNKIKNFYERSDIEKHFPQKKTTPKVLSSDEEGVFLHPDTKVPVHPKHYWCTKFKIHSKTFDKKLANYKPLQAKYPDNYQGYGQHRTWDFYPEDIVLQCFTDWVSPDIPRANRFGILTHPETGESCRTASGWSRFLHLGDQIVLNKLQDAPFVEGKPLNGNSKFYPVSEVKKYLADLLKEVPKADENGFFTDESGETYGLVPRWADKLGISTNYLRKHLADKPFTQARAPVKGKKPRLRNFYAESVVRESLPDLFTQVGVE